MSTHELVSPATRALACSLLLALALLAVVPATAAPPPESVCRPCQEGLEWSAHRHGVALDVTDSTADVRVHSNGSATWTVTSRFEDRVPERYGGEAAETDRNESFRDPSALATDRRLRRTIAREMADAADDNSDEEIRLRSLSANKSVITVVFREPTVGRETPAGVLLVDEFHTDGRGNGWYVDVDRLRIVGPPNTTLANDVESAVGSAGTVEGRTLTLTGNATDPPSLPEEDFYLAFAPSGGWAGPLATLAIASVTVPRFLGRFLATQAPGAVVLALSLGAVVWLRRNRGERLDRRSLLLWLGAATALYLLVTLSLLPPVDRFQGLSFGPILTGIRLGIALAAGVGAWFGYALLSERERV
ncbi:hypothetical protein [Halorientalis halophila]|uniref:hypothetical protein n=1 Tax=Halorientalis halophila TaxID=3108499 RepID=UPI003009D925